MQEQKVGYRFASAVIAVVAAIALVMSTMTFARADTLTVQADANNSTTAVASAGTGEGTITIALPTAKDGDTYNYKVYKVFDATYTGTATDGTNPASYKLMDGKSGVPDITTGSYKFAVDGAGNVYYGTVGTDSTATGAVPLGNNQYVVPQKDMTAADVEAANAAIKTYLGLDGAAGVTPATPAADVNVASSFKTLKISGLGLGYYYVTTDVGSAVGLTTTNPDATIEEKNDVPSVTKTITAVGSGSIENGNKRAIAAVGSTVTYQAVIHAKKGAKNYVFKDLLASGLDLNTGSIEVKKGAGATSLTANTDYTLDTTPVANDYTFKITFADSFLKTIDADSDINVTYTATVTNYNLDAPNPADATNQGSVNGRNSATISYGGTGNTPSFTSTPDTTIVYNAMIQPRKVDGSNNALSDAEFVLKNVQGNYYVFNTSTNTYSWGTEDNATVLSSNSQYDGRASNGTLGGFAGLPDGTYTLVEKKAPDGYNKAADMTITVNGANAENALTSANLWPDVTVVNYQGIVLPSTGGMGTTLLYVIGALLVIAAGIALVVRRRMRRQ